ncbi:hypothetical protein IB75_06455 [Nitrosococcus oceani C-27]|uniref:Uncharacterized protein n=1 Tax=Nitrosococcus oceani C-27 TaxID=314279 RepID=A0A0E2Z898_9GAMM|nr:hypothetical protein IB75_06455 [Nitrosococcus oceani C-27]
MVVKPKGHKTPRGAAQVKCAKLFLRRKTGLQNTTPLFQYLKAFTGKMNHHPRSMRVRQAPVNHHKGSK